MQGDRGAGVVRPDVPIRSGRHVVQVLGAAVLLVHYALPLHHAAHLEVRACAAGLADLRCTGENDGNTLAVIKIPHFKKPNIMKTFSSVSK